MKKNEKPSRHNLRRIILSLLIAVLATLSPNIAAADPESDRVYIQQLTERTNQLKSHIDGMRKQIGKTARSKGMQLSGGGSTNRLAGNTIGRSSEIADRTQSRLPDTGIRYRETYTRRQTPETLLENNRTSRDENFEIVKNRLDALENRVRAYRRELKKHEATQIVQNDGNSKAKDSSQLSDWTLLEMEREAQRIEKEVGAYAALAAKTP
ncbi:MAG: hypothetical protein O7D88_08370 [Gammaproteobacteria bacterium]|nr:hypothetical protein [Gammaproteobacteria bacterium]